MKHWVKSYLIVFGTTATCATSGSQRPPRLSCRCLAARGIHPGSQASGLSMSRCLHEFSSSPASTYSPRSWCRRLWLDRQISCYDWRLSACMGVWTGMLVNLLWDLHSSLWISVPGRIRSLTIANSVCAFRFGTWTRKACRVVRSSLPKTHRTGIRRPLPYFALLTQVSAIYFP